MEVCGGVLDLGDVTRDFFDEARADRLSVLCRAADKGQKVRGRAGTRVVNHLSVSLRRALKIDANSDVRVGTRQQGWGYLILMSCRASFSGQRVLACAGDMTGAFPCRCWRSRWGLCSSARGGTTRSKGRHRNAGSTFAISRFRYTRCNLFERRFRVFAIGCRPSVIGRARRSTA